MKDEGRRCLLSIGGVAMRAAIGQAPSRSPSPLGECGTRLAEG